MTRERSGSFGRHVSFELKNTLRLPAAAKEEIDIEGLDRDGGYLWLIGSHSAKREKADKGKTAAENLERLSRVELDGKPVHAGQSAARRRVDAGREARAVDGRPPRR